MHMIKSIAAAFALLVVTAALADSAAALTVSPTGSFTTTTGVVRLGWQSNGQSVTCSSSSLTFSLAADGTGTVPAGSATYSSCRNSIFGSFTLVQRQPWSITTILSGGLVSLVWTVPTGGLTIAMTGCTYTLGGTFTLSAAAGALPATLSWLSQAGAFTIDGNNSGPLCGFSPVGLAFTTTATNVLSPSLTVG